MSDTQSSLPPLVPNTLGLPAELKLDDLSILARTLWGEARGEDRQGREMVASCIVNRVLISQQHPHWWGSTVMEVCLHPWQFSCWLKADPNREKLIAVTETDPIYAECLEIAAAAIAGTLVDMTGGATGYLNVALTLKVEGKLPPFADHAAAALDDLPFFAELSKQSYTRFTVKEDDVEATVTDHDGYRVITGRGTKSPIDALRDAMFVPTWCDELEMRVHEGFLKATRIIANRLWKYIDIDAPVIFNGHSYGGAVMTGVSAFAVRFGLHPAGLVTQGCPRVGDHRLAKILKDVPTRRMVMPGDIVPMVPFGLFFRHVGKPIRMPIPGPLLPGIGPHAIAHYEVGARYLLAEQQQKLRTA